MRAKMKDNIVERYEAMAPSFTDLPDQETKDFLRSIEGKEVDLVFVCGDAFESNDNNIWLPDSLWDAAE
jgi:hypothetical protein